jgi:hypothetical protein
VKGLCGLVCLACDKWVMVVFENAVRLLSMLILMLDGELSEELTTQKPWSWCLGPLMQHLFATRKIWSLLLQRRQTDDH